MKRIRVQDLMLLKLHGVKVVHIVFGLWAVPEVVKILERSYDVHITFATDSLRDFRFYGSFGRGEQGIKDILEALEKTGKVHYIQDEQEITLY